MDKQETFSGEESLKLINRMIHEAKGYYYESGLAGLIYGFSIAICSLLAYARDRDLIRFPFSPFYLLIPIFFVQAFVQMREEKKKQAKTFTDEAIDYVWMGFFLSAFASCCAVFAGQYYLPVSIVMILTGLATFMTGMLAKFKYHIYISFGCWLLGIFSFFMEDERAYLLLALTAVLAWIIPGFLLRSHFKKIYGDKKDQP